MSAILQVTVQKVYISTLDLQSYFLVLRLPFLYTKRHITVMYAAIRRCTVFIIPCELKNQMSMVDARDIYMTLTIGKTVTKFYRHLYLQNRRANNGTRTVTI